MRALPSELRTSTEITSTFKSLMAQNNNTSHSKSIDGLLLLLKLPVDGKID